MTPIRTIPLCFGVGLLIAIPTIVSYALRSTLPQENKPNVRTVARHPIANTGTYKGTPWKNDNTLATKLLGETPFARCDVHSVILEDGKTVINDWIFMEERNAVNVAVQTTENQWLVFETQKYAIPGKTLSPVGGFINDGESPWEAARREVWEELGVGSTVTKADMEQGTALQESKESKANPFGVDIGVNVPVDEHGLAKGIVPEAEPDWIFLGRYRTMANRGGGFLYAYFLKNAVPLVEGGGSSVFSSHGDYESQKFMSLKNVEMKKALENGDFQEVKWALTHSLALQHLQTVMET